jgi:hypothetical protein
VPPFAGRDTLTERLGERRRLLGFGYSRAQLEQAGPRDMRERELGIGCDSALQLLPGADIRRQQQVDPGDIAIGGLDGVRGERQPEAVRQDHEPRLPSVTEIPTIA